MDASPPPRSGADLARDVDRGVRALRRRVGIGLFLGGVADGVLWLAATLAASLLVARLFGFAPSPSPYALALLVGPLLLGLVRTRARGLTVAEGALHLDRRLALDALLSTSVEVDTSAWSARLEDGLRDPSRALPRLRVGRLAARTLVPLAVLLGVASLPAPEGPPSGPPNPLFHEALARLEQKIELLERERVLEPEIAQSERERAEALERKADAREATPWSDLDALAERLARATEEKSSALESLQSDLAELASGRPGADSTKSAAERLAALANAAVAAGLAPRLSPELLKRLGLDRPGASVDPSSLPTDLAALKALADALAGATGARLAELARAGLVDAGELADLQKLLAGDASSDPFAKGTRCPTCLGERPEGCGT